MISAQSRRQRRIVASLDRGSDLFESLRSVCAEHGVRCGELRGSGALEVAELCAYDQGQHLWKPKRVLGSGGLELLHLLGSISEERGELSIVARATLMRDRDSGVEIVGGRLIGARVFAVELVIDSFDDLLLRRGPDLVTGLDVWQEALEDGAPPRRELPDDPEPTLDEFEPVSASGFDAPAPEPTRTTEPMAAQVPAPEVALPDEVRLAAGDVIVHPKFRRCVVQRVEGNHEFVQVRLRNGRVVRLSLDVIELIPQGTENGQRVFEVSIG